MIIIATTFAIDALIFILFKNVIDQTVLNMISVLLQSIVLLFVFKKRTQSKWILVFLILSYIIRLGYLFFDIYANGTYMLFNDYIDSLGFHNRARDILNGTLNPIFNKKGNYVIFLTYIYRIFGINQFMGSYINVLLSTITQLILLKILQYINIDDKKKLVPLAVFCFFPASILYSSILVRESILVFAITLSIYFFIKWFKEGNILLFFLTLLPIVISAFLHSGMIVLIFIYLLILGLYNRKEKKLVLSWKLLIFVVITIIGLTLLYLVLKKSLFEKFNVLFSGDYQRVFDTLKYSVGGSAYLPDIEYSSIWDIIWQVPIRIFHFLMSPVPWQWRGLKDAGAFILDSMFYLVFLFIWVPLYKRTSKENRLLFLIFTFQFIVFTLVFSHGTYTAGTAIRHRFKSAVIIVTIYALSGDGDPFKLNEWPGKIKKVIAKRKNSNGK